MLIFFLPKFIFFQQFTFVLLKYNTLDMKVTVPTTFFRPNQISDYKGAFGYIFYTKVTNPNNKKFGKRFHKHPNGTDKDTFEFSGTMVDLWSLLFKQLNLKIR